MAATKKTFMSSADFESSDDKLKALEAAKLQIEEIDAGLAAKTEETL